MKTTSNTGISSTGGTVTNTGTITLEKLVQQEFLLKMEM